MKKISKRLSNVTGIFTCPGSGRVLSKRLPLGLAAASNEHFACNCALMPALAIVTVCCSIASCIAERSFSSILSISSMHASPPLASTSVPASSVQRPSPNSSRTAAAVRPAADEDLPVAITPRGASRAAARSSCDLATPGSPIISTWMSPRMRVPSGRCLSTPPKSCIAIASFCHFMP